MTDAYFSEPCRAVAAKIALLPIFQINDPQKQRKFGGKPFLVDPPLVR